MYRICVAQKEGVTEGVAWHAEFSHGNPVPCSVNLESTNQILQKTNKFAALKYAPPCSNTAALSTRCLHSLFLGSHTHVLLRPSGHLSASPLPSALQSMMIGRLWSHLLYVVVDFTKVPSHSFYPTSQVKNIHRIAIQ